jgi:hypothetical protein
MATTKAELEMQLDAARQKIAALEEQSAGYKSKLGNIDAQRPGMTDAEKATFDEQVAHRDQQIEDLRAALAEEERRNHEIQSKLDQALNSDSVAEALAAFDEDDIEFLPVAGTVGRLHTLPDVEPAAVGLFAKPVNGLGYPGVLLVTVSGAEVQPVQFIKDWVLKGSARSGYHLKPSAL